MTDSLAAAYTRGHALVQPPADGWASHSAMLEASHEAGLREVAKYALERTADVLDRVADNFEDFGLPEGMDGTHFRIKQMRIDAQFVRDTAPVVESLDTHLYEWKIRG